MSLKNPLSETANRDTFRPIALKMTVFEVCSHKVSKRLFAFASVIALLWNDR